MTCNYTTLCVTNNSRFEEDSSFVYLRAGSRILILGRSWTFVAGVAHWGKDGRADCNFLVHSSVRSCVSLGKFGVMPSKSLSSALLSRIRWPSSASQARHPWTVEAAKGGCDKSSMNKLLGHLVLTRFGGGHSLLPWLPWRR